MESKFEQIEKVNKVKLLLKDESVVTGESWGIIDAQDDDGESLGYDVLIFKTDSLDNPLTLKEEEILNVEEAS